MFSLRRRHRDHRKNLPNPGHPLRDGASGGPRRLVRLSGRTMGTTWQVALSTRLPDTEDLRQALDAAVTRVDRQMSTWQPDSDLMLFNAAPCGAWHPIPAEMARVIETGLEVTRASGGAFDMALGTAVNAWGFGPDPATAPAAGPAPAAQVAIELNPALPALRKSAPCDLDLCGIAKGFGADELARVLEEHGVTDYLAIIDGEGRSRGLRPDGQRWTLALEAPLPGRSEAWDVMAPIDIGFATSGDYRHFFMRDGQIRSHTIDPATGEPVFGPLASVTVFDTLSMRADAWATALMVMGAERGLAMAQLREIPAIFLIRTPDGLTERRTGALPIDQSL